MTTFQVGDRVECIDEQIDRQLIGMVGFIVKVNEEEGGEYSNSPELYDVDFGKKIKQNCASVNDTTHRFAIRELKLVNIVEEFEVDVFKAIFDEENITIIDGEGDCIEIPKDKIDSLIKLLKKDKK